MKEHTPGPWKLNTDGDTGMNDSGCILDSIGHVIVTDIYGTFKNGRTTGEAEANARLIAAAPDLLAACRDAIDFIWAEMKENPDKEDMDGSIMDRLIELQAGLISVWRKAGGVK